MASPSFQSVAPPAPTPTAPNWAVAKVRCLKPSQFAADSWIEGLSVWGAEANWGAAWFDKQFQNSHPDLVCHLSPGQKFYWLLTELQGQPQGAQLYAAFNAGWQKVIADNAQTLSPQGCNGQRGRPLDKAKIDSAVICPAGGGAFTQSQEPAPEPATAQPQSMKPAGLSPAAKAKADAKTLEELEAKKASQAKADADKAKKEAAECRPLALWKTWFYGVNMADGWQFSEIQRDSTNARLQAVGVNVSKPGAVVALMSGKSVDGKTLDQIFPDKYPTPGKGPGNFTLRPKPYGAATWQSAIKKAYVDPEMAEVFADCPTSEDMADSGTTGSQTASFDLGGNTGLLLLAAAAAWAVSR